MMNFYFALVPVNVKITTQCRDGERKIGSLHVKKNVLG